ncbi:MAG: hypothetical protein Q9166_005141 [cf. Caloplaca sp. 2 TL-2023]
MEDVDLPTFVRFLEWTYNDTYTAAIPDHESSPSGIALAEDNPDQCYVVESPLEWGSTKKKKKHKGNTELGSFDFDHNSMFGPTSRDGLRQAFIARSYTGSQPALPVPRARRNKNENESYQDVFLCHAQLYVFAEKWKVSKLKTLALENLHETLTHFTLYEKRTPDIVTLLRYVYQNTQPPEKTENEPLRALLTDYIGFEMDTLIKDADFKTLMIEDGGPLLGDFVEMVARRIRE